MAYLRNTNLKQDEAQQGGNTGLLGGYMAQQQGPFGAAGGVAPSAAQGSGPTGTGHVNFDSIYAANAGTAANMANQLGGKVQGDVQGAQTGLSNLQSAYGADLSKGAGSGPTGDQIAWARNGSTGVEQPGRVTSAYIAPQGSDPKNAGMGGSQSGVTQENAGLSSESTKGGGVGGNRGDGVNMKPVGNQLAGIQAGANAQYQGPDNLQQMKGYGGLLDQYTSAGKELGAVGSNAGLQGILEQQNAGPYIEGGSRLDAALTGQAGRPAFADLQQKNQGFGSQLGNAVTASTAQSEAAKAKAKQNQNAYGSLLSQYTDRQGADQSAADAVGAQNASKIGAAQQAANAANTPDPNDPKNWGASQWIRNIGGAVSPIDDILHATGNKGPIDYSTDYFENQYGPIGGTYSQQDDTLNPNRKKKP